MNGIRIASALTLLALLLAAPAWADDTTAKVAPPVDVTSPGEQTFVCRKVETMHCPDPKWCADSYHCTLKIWLSSPDPTRSYIGISSQIHGAGDWRIYDTWHPSVYNHAERAAVSGYVFDGYDTRNAGSIAGDFGHVFTVPPDHDTPGKQALAVNVFNAWGDPGPLGYRGSAGLSLIVGGHKGTHGSAAILAHPSISEGVRWYRLAHFMPGTLHPDTIGGIWFDRAGPANFITITPEDDVDATAMRITDARFTKILLDVRKSGRVIGSSPYDCLFPTFSFMHAEGAGLCALGRGALGLAVGSEPKILLTPDRAQIKTDAEFSGAITAPNLGPVPARGGRVACLDEKGRLYRAGPSGRCAP